MTPLFPLQAVLFPGGLLRLKVFEARYLDLMTSCLRERQPFGVVGLRSGGFDPADVYYFGESVLRASHRGHGIGHAFFDHREACARELGFKVAAFCAVVRPLSHPRRPTDYTPHNIFWQKRGFAERRDIQAQFAWRDLDEPAETPKAMVFWVKELAP